MGKEASLVLGALLSACASAPPELPAPAPGVATTGTSTRVLTLASSNEMQPVAPAPSPTTSAVTIAEPSLDPLAHLPSAEFSTSIGSPTQGQLKGGVALPLTADGLRYNDRRSSNARFATTEVIAAILRAARAVQRDLPGSELVVNDIGLESGGAIAHHGSHRAGRDADILFYLLGDDGLPTPSVGAPIDPEGIGFDYKELSEPGDDVRVHFDAPRTFRFVRALIEDPEARLQRIFVAEHLRRMLLSEAERVHAPAEVVSKLSDMTCQPSYPHDDHLHVRWYCSDQDLTLGCQDLPPLYPWHSQELAERGIKPVLAQRVKSSDPAPIETQAEADRAVKRQKPHPSVLAFLARRKAWEKQPHPGREYCR